MKQQQRAGPGRFQIPVAAKRRYKPNYTAKQRIDCLDCLHFNRKECCCMIGEENCILTNGLQASDKPKECKYCYWWNPVTKSCRRNSIGGCAYEFSDSKSEQTIVVLSDNPSEAHCRNCPYSRDHSGVPCVSFCMKNVLADWMAERGKMQM